MPSPRLSSKQIEQVSDWVAAYIADQRAQFRMAAKPIPANFAELMRPFFPSDVLCAVRVIRGRGSEPPFYSQLHAMGILNVPRFSDMAGVTFQDVVVHVEPLAASLLFHELVHAVQYKHLGLDGFAGYYVRGFLSGGSYEEIPLEKQAYALEAKFANDSSTVFSVEDDVKNRIRLNQL